MRIESWMCLGGVEIGNYARTSTYLNNLGISGASVTMPTACACAAIDDGYDTPSADPAPWYETSRPESDEFFGFWPVESEVQDVLNRNVNQNGPSGSVISPATAKGRIVQVSGNLLARTPQAMAYGQRWLTEALRGTFCDNYITDDLNILPACPESGYDEEDAFRILVNSALVSGPVFTPLSDLPECYVTQAAFIIVSTQPWLYHPAFRAIDGLDLSVDRSASLTTPTWMGEGTFRIELTNEGIVDATDITVTGQISLDGSCPVTGDGTSVPPTFTYTIPALAPEDTLVIDGARRQVVLVDASAKFSSPGYSMLDFTGPFTWPDVSTCTQMCVTISGGNADTVVTVDTYLREY